MYMNGKFGIRIVRWCDVGNGILYCGMWIIMFLSLMFIVIIMMWDVIVMYEIFYDVDLESFDNFGFIFL